ncbi:MAG TPA: response regulator [Anaerolineales bacterium]
MDPNATPSCVLLVDDQRNIMHLLHAALDKMGHKLDIIEAPSGEEALLTATRRRIDLLIVDYRLPGINGIELIHKIRARHPQVKVIIISGMLDRKSREEMINAGAVAVFSKPISLADFLDAVERSLGLARTIFPPDTGSVTITRQNRLSELLVNFRQDIDALAVFLISDRGLVLARAGALKDSSMEVSLISSLMSIHAAGLKVSRFIHQDSLENYHVFSGGDQDLIFIPVDPSYSLLLAGEGLAERARLIEMVHSIVALKENVEKALTHLGVTGPLPPAEEIPAAPPAKDAAPAGELEKLLKQAGKTRPRPQEVEDFWNRAAEQHGKAASNPDVISYDQARKMGLLPGDEK